MACLHLCGGCRVCFWSRANLLNSRPFIVIQSSSYFEVTTSIWCHLSFEATNICSYMQLLNKLSQSTRYFAGVSLDRPVVTSCGTGVTACILALVSPVLHLVTTTLLTEENPQCPVDYPLLSKSVVFIRSQLFWLPYIIAYEWETSFLQIYNFLVDIDRGR